MYKFIHATCLLSLGCFGFADVSAACASLERAQGLTQGTVSTSSSNKAGQETCDGALDIVPSKAATFFRKRRVSVRKPVAKPETKSNSKAIR